LYPVSTGDTEAVHDAAICVLPGVNERAVAAAGSVGNVPDDEYALQLAAFWARTVNE
jgi:hypothetical protein